MSVSDQELLHHLGRMPFVDTAELAMILGEAHVTIHRGLAGLLDDGIVGRVSHGTAHLPSSRRHYLTAKGIAEAAGVLGFDTPADFVRAYPVSREWLTLLIRRMDAVASVYRLAASLSPGTDGLRTQVDFHRRGRFDAVITRHNGRSFGVVRQGPALRRRSLYDRLRAIAEYDYRCRPGTVLVLTPSVWEQRLTTRFCENANLEESYVAVESREALEDWNSNAWRYASWVFGSLPYSLEFISTRGSPNRGRFTEPPERKRASLPDREHMVSSAPAFSLTPSEKRTLDLITDHPMIPREHLARWLGVSEGRVSQMLHNLVNAWELLERRGKRGDVRYTLSEEGIRYVTHRDRAQLPTTRGIWSTELTTDNRRRRRHVGHRIETWARQTSHADGVTWFLSELAAEARATADSELTWSIPTAKTDRAFNWGESAIAPDAVGKLVVDGLHIPFYLEHELRARHPKGVLARLRPYTRYYWSNAPGEDMAPFPGHPVRGGQRGGGGDLREDGFADEPDDAAHPGVVSAGADPAWPAGPVLAPPVGAALPEAGAVGAARLPVGLAAAPDASDRGGYVMGLLTQPHLPTMPAGCPKLSRQAPIPWSGEAEKDPKWADFRQERGLTQRLTGQGEK